MLRIQLAPALLYVVAVIWLTRRAIATRLILGILAAVSLFGLLDWITLGVPFRSAFMYVHANIVEGRSQTGPSPG